MGPRIQFVIRLEKKDNWLHEQHAWSIPLLNVPGIKLIGVLNEGVMVERSAYHVDYTSRLLRGQGVQHLNGLSVQLCFTRRLTGWGHVMLSSLIGFAGMIVLFCVSFTEAPDRQQAKTIRMDSTPEERVVPVKDSAKTSAQLPEQKTKPKVPPPIMRASCPYISNTTAMNDPERREVIIAIGVIPDSAGMNGKPVQEDMACTLAVAGALEQKSCKTYSRFFTPSIYTNGVFLQLMGADFSQVPLDMLKKSADELCIGTVWRHTHPAISQKDMFVAEIHLNICFRSFGNGQVTRVDKTFTKPGFTTEQALSLANEDMKKFLNANL